MLEGNLVSKNCSGKEFDFMRQLTCEREIW